jgi:hypothetical protein
MTVDNTITKFPHPASQEKTITLDEAIQSMTEWRINKGTRGEQIPDDIWKNIFTLLKKYPEATVSSQLPKTPHIDFCEVNQTQTPLYKPARIPATNTLVVEFCRADGRIMKIHTTTDSFSELMKAFFAGE